MTTLTIHLEDERARILEKEAARAGVSVEEWVRRRLSEAAASETAPGNFSAKSVLNELEEFWASLPPDYVPPTDEQIEQLKLERRMKRAK